MIKLNYFFCFFFLFHFLSTNAQVAEELAVHFDKPFYVAGEDAWFKIYFKNDAKEIKSKVIRVDWLSPNGEILQQQKLRVENNYAIGDLPIPYDWAEGNYQFRAYTLWGLNFGETNYFQQVIPIYNLEETPIIAERPEALVPLAGGTQTEETNVQILVATNAVNYKKRAPIEVTIQLKDKAGNPIAGHFSLAVTDDNYLTEISPVLTTHLSYSTKASFQQKYMPETGLNLKGILLDAAGTPLDTRFLSIYFPKTKTFEKTTVSKGALNLNIPDFEGVQMIQFFDMNPFHEPIPSLKKNSIKLPVGYQGTPIFRSEAVANYLFLLNKYRQYREAFGMPSPDYGPTFSFKQATWTYDKTWSLEKYTALSDLASFAAEIISSGRVVGRGTNKSIRLQYAEKNIYNNLSPWYLVNNWLTDDEKTVLKIPFRDIESIQMFNSKERIASQLDPSMVSRGLLAIQTKDGKTPDALVKKPNNVNITGFAPVRTFPTKVATDTRIPDLRPLIYWNASIQTDENGQAKLLFNHSDAIGKAQITVVGQTKDGDLGYGTTSYQVSFD